MLKGFKMANIKYNSIVKSNKLVESSYKLTIQEQRLIYAILAKYDQMQELPQICELTALEFKEIYEEHTTIDFYQQLKRAVNTLYDRDITHYNRETDSGWRVRWVQFIEYDKEESKAILEWSNKILPEICKLKESFTKLKMQKVAKLKSIYSIRIYEMLMQYNSTRQLHLTIEDLRFRLKLEEKYKDFYVLNKKAIAPAIKELNEKLNLKIKLKVKKKGRTYNDFYFTWTDTSEINPPPITHNKYENLEPIQTNLIDYIEEQPKKIIRKARKVVKTKVVKK